MSHAAAEKRFMSSHLRAACYGV